MKDRLGSATDVNEFLKARTVFEKMRTDVEAKTKADSVPVGKPTGNGDDATSGGKPKPSGPTDAEKAAALLEKQKLDLEFTVSLL